VSAGALLLDAVVSALANVVLLAALPFLFYFLRQRRRGLSFPEMLDRVGLRVGELRYAGYCVLLAFLFLAFLTIRPLPLEPYLREGSPQASFLGLGWAWPAIPMALLYGIVKTGFAEEFLFRGMIAGALARKTSFGRANLLQALIFLAPHLLVMLVMPELWPILPVIFVTSLFAGWVRIRSGSFLGPWILHAAVNVHTCLSVAARTAAG
jgi:membrane protease YdiL (CAAX protease family)